MFGVKIEILLMNLILNQLCLRIDLERMDAFDKNSPVPCFGSPFLQFLLPIPVQRPQVSQSGESVSSFTGRNSLSL